MTVNSGGLLPGAPVRSRPGRSASLLSLPVLWRVVGAFVDLVMPRVCAGCAMPGGAVCPDCTEALSGPAFLATPGYICPGGDPLTPGCACPGGDPRTPGHAATPGRRGPPACFAAAAYGGPVRAILLAYKERGRLDAARPLAVALARAAAAAAVLGVSPRPLLLVPVPSSRPAVRRRGFDHVARLASDAARELRHCGLAAEVAPMLVPVRHVADQAGMSARERAMNVAGAFEVRGIPSSVHRLRDRPDVIVVDDIVTTGATLAEAARALRACGVDVAGAAVVAATPGRVSAI